MELIDLYPTLAKLVGFEVPEQLQGTSLTDYLVVDDRKAADDDALIQAADGFCLRTPKWAFMRYAKGDPDKAEHMLYDMEKDPRQFQNLAGKTEYAEVERRMSQRLTDKLEAIKP